MGTEGRKEDGGKTHCFIGLIGFQGGEEKG